MFKFFLWSAPAPSGTLCPSSDHYALDMEDDSIASLPSPKRSKTKTRRTRDVNESAALETAPVTPSKKRSAAKSKKAANEPSQFPYVTPSQPPSLAPTFLCPFSTIPKPLSPPFVLRSLALIP